MLGSRWATPELCSSRSPTELYLLTHRTHHTVVQFYSFVCALVKLRSFSAAVQLWTCGICLWAPNRLFSFP